MINSLVYVRLVREIVCSKMTKKGVTLERFLNTRLRGPIATARQVATLVSHEFSVTPTEIRDGLGIKSVGTVYSLIKAASKRARHNAQFRELVIEVSTLSQAAWAKTSAKSTAKVSEPIPVPTAEFVKNEDDNGPSDLDLVLFAISQKPILTPSMLVEVFNIPWTDFLTSVGRVALTFKGDPELMAKAVADGNKIVAEKWLAGL